MHGPAGFQQVQHRQRLVHPNRHRVVGIPLPLDQRKVQVVTDLVPKGMRIKFAKRSVQSAVANFFKQRLGTAAMRNQIGNRPDLQAMRGSKQL